MKFLMVIVFAAVVAPPLEAVVAAAFALPLEPQPAQANAMARATAHSATRKRG
jgi:hypothetical protein